MTIPHSLYSLKHVDDNTTLGMDFVEFNGTMASSTIGTMASNYALARATLVTEEL